MARENTLMIMLGFQALLMFLAMTVVDTPENRRCRYYSACNPDRI